MTYTAIDLFSGAGGFSLGVQNAGMRIIAAADSDEKAVETYRENFTSHECFSSDLRTFTPAMMSEKTGCKTVDVIVGGPPCQGFSRVKGGNHGARIVEDERRELYRPFLDYVQFFQPKIFVMENVPGLKTAVGGAVFRDIEAQVRNIGYTFHNELLRAWHFGVPQKRHRLIIAGFRKDIASFTGEEWIKPTHADTPGGGLLKKQVSLWEAIGDLPRLQAGKGADKYDLRRREEFAARHDDSYIRNVAEVYKTDALTGHVARPHLERDLRDFKVLREGESSAVALRRGAKMEFPYDREKFTDRYTKQHRNRLSSTIIAHMSRDGLMFIHPVQSRSLTPREAARIQSFPDRFNFPVPRTHQFRLIGNAVPPLMGEAIARAVIRHLKANKCRPPLASAA